MGLKTIKQVAGFNLRLYIYNEDENPKLPERCVVEASKVCDGVEIIATKSIVYNNNPEIATADYESIKTKEDLQAFINNASRLINIIQER